MYKVKRECTFSLCTSMQNMNLNPISPRREEMLFGGRKNIMPSVQNVNKYHNTIDENIVCAPKYEITFGNP